MKLGYALSSEEHRPLDLVDHARLAEEAGFSFALVSDHYHPWIDRQGESPFVWGVLGAMAVATERLVLGTGVTCPTIRIHPAIIAQAAATAASLLPGRFLLGVGTGENLNEHVLGDRWPATADQAGDARRVRRGDAGALARRADLAPRPPLHGRERARLHVARRADPRARGGGRGEGSRARRRDRRRSRRHRA